MQHIPLDTDWMGLRKATSSLWDLRRHRKQIFCVSCPLIKNIEGIKNGFSHSVAYAVKSILCQIIYVKREELQETLAMLY